MKEKQTTKPQLRKSTDLLLRPQQPQLPPPPAAPSAASDWRATGSGRLHVVRMRCAVACIPVVKKKKKIIIISKIWCFALAKTHFS